MNKMVKKKECDEGREYGCPYIKKCSGNYCHISSEDLSCFNVPEHLWDFVKNNSTKTSKVWFNPKKEFIYICQPVVKNRTTFYELERSKLISKIKKNLLTFINESNTQLKEKIKNIERELK
jgi:hypothetical protein